MVNLMLSYGRCLQTGLLRSEKTTKIIQRNASRSKVTIPPRINRGKLDILQALANTVKIEPGVPEYRLQYGRLFEANINYFQRLLSLAMDSGRAAAKWVVAENPKLFQHQYADPYIKAFAPPRIFDENTEASEVMLIDAIENVQVEDAIKLYKVMKEKNIDVSTETKQGLLEMVSFFNGQNKADETLLENKYYENREGTVINVWNKNGFAEELFLEMEPSADAYTALILGRIKYKNIIEAIKLYEEGKEKGMKFGVDVYNALLENAVSQKYEHQDQKEYIVELLKEMKVNNIEPNIGTLNSTLSSVVAMKKWRDAKSFAAEVYHEFRSIGIRPSLATYYYLIEIFMSRNQVMPAFHEILSETADKLFVPSHPDDFKFFNKAMEVATYNFKSLDMSHRIHKLLQTGSNRYFLDGNLKVTNYYRSYLTSAFRYGQLDEAVGLLETCVPQAYSPEPIGVSVIMGALEEREGSQFLPRVWPLIQLTVSKSDKLCPLVMSVLVTGISLYEDKSYLNIAKEMWELSQRKEIINDSQYLSSFLKAFSIGQDKEYAFKALVKSVNLGIEICAVDYESLKLYTDFCISNDERKVALMCVEYAVTARYKQADKIAKTVRSKLQLTEEEKNFIDAVMKKHKKPSQFGAENSEPQSPAE